MPGATPANSKPAKKYAHCGSTEFRSFLNASYWRSMNSTLPALMASIGTFAAPRPVEFCMSTTEVSKSVTDRPMPKHGPQAETFACMGGIATRRTHLYRCDGDADSITSLFAANSILRLSIVHYQKRRGDAPHDHHKTAANYLFIRTYSSSCAQKKMCPIIRDHHRLLRRWPIRLMSGIRQEPPWCRRKMLLHRCAS